jgi:hypothetical protein
MRCVQCRLKGERRNQNKCAIYSLASLATLRSRARHSSFRFPEQPPDGTGWTTEHKLIIPLKS